MLQGIAVSPGFAIGRVHRVDRRRIKEPRYHVAESQIPAEVKRFKKALTDSEEQVLDIKSKLQSAGEEHVLILDAHQLMIRDAQLVDNTIELIESQAINAEWAFKKVIRSIKRMFDNIDEEYFRERRSDVDFVGERIMRNLLGTAQPSLSHVGPGTIVVAHDLSPADTAFLMRTAILGFATDVGGKTSHTAIMARSLELPAVVGLEQLSDQVGTGDTLIIDGITGQVIINPTPADLTEYQKRQLNYSATRAELDAVRHDPAITKDGMVVDIRGNIELPDETQVVLDYGASGVGLYRTEYLYMNRQTLPGEAEQAQHYRTVLELAGEYGATIRTLDLGGDKLIDSLKQNPELNPIMGLRAVRFCLKETGIFRTQLRALLRASVHGTLRIMVPLISGLEEIRAVKAHLAACQAELRQEGVEFAENIPLGVMIELPSAAMIADLIAKEVDFFAIGTNDLIQYMLAIDRSNEAVAHLYQPLHPSMLRLLKNIIDAAAAANIPVSMCGEMAGDPLYVPVLMGLGLRELSMNAMGVPLIKSVIRSVALEDCETLVEELWPLAEGKAIERVVSDRLATLLQGAVSTSIFDPAARRTPTTGQPANRG